MAETYTHGHHESVLRSHRWRTVENSAAYLAPLLRPGLDVLDVGCGPGTITVDLAGRVAPGRVVGIDASEDVIEEARAAATGAAAAPTGSGAGPSIELEVGDVYDLRYDDASFDVVHAHQVLQHLTDPVRALVEMRRVVRPDGVVAARDSDYRSIVIAPEDDRLERWRQLYLAVTRANRAEASAGKHLLGWAQQAGFRHVEASGSAWVYADEEKRRWWSGVWAERAVKSAFADQAVAYGLADRTELEEIAAGWRHWGEQPDGYFGILHGEILARP